MSHQITNLQLCVIMSAYVGNGMFDTYEITDTYRRQTTSLLDAGIIKSSMVASGHGYKFDITEKGSFYLNSLLATPFPVEVKSWKIPEDK